DDCEVGSTCQGASVCPAGAECFVADRPGTCVVAGCYDPSGVLRAIDERFGDCNQCVCEADGRIYCTADTCSPNCGALTCSAGDICVVTYPGVYGAPTQYRC